MTAFLVSPPSAPLIGSVAVPGDKSIGHRAVMFAALADGESTITGLSAGADNQSTLAAVQALGARVRHELVVRQYKGNRQEHPVCVITGRGVDGLSIPTAPIDCGNAGTGMRLLAGLLAGQRFDSTLVGDESLTARPMRRIVEPLSRMGAQIRGDEHDGNLYPPLFISGARSLVGMSYRSPVASAQVKSAILLAGLYADGTTEVIEPGPSRDHTERMLAYLGAPVVASGEQRVSLDPKGWDRKLRPSKYEVPADPSSAAFVIGAALVCPVDRVGVRDVCVNPTRTGFLDVLSDMGARVEREMMATTSGEPIATLVVSRGAADGLCATRVAGPVVVRAIDELPLLAVVAAFADGITEFADAAELRVKESDRITTTVNMLRAFGVDVEERTDGLSVQGVPGRTLAPGHVDSAGDHRIAMAGAVLALAASGESRIENVDNVATSFPGFSETMRGIGATITVV